MMTNENKVLDFWSLLKAINTYDTWLSNMLISCVKEAGSPDEYAMLRMCREKLQELLNNG